MTDSTSAAKTTATKSPAAFSDDELAAMKDHAEELKKSARRGGKSSAADGESDLLEKIAQMSEPDRSMATRVHELVKAAAPELVSKTWYGMPAYAKNGQTICFFQSAAKFKSRFATLGFSDKAQLDDGDIWPIYYALQELTPAVEERITELVKRAVG